ncbi:hypothetical protein [Novosphingobium sp. KN65.2]|uniref:hypothetical protein n=1 Tax=Novosphingobium sp. KN65.2 TaxID=1478134 RepID=UPI0005E51FE2|nr:hypothetical protein [Novosphingobium sp. KN65.2]CDO35000.1 hypothetical protein SPHV1_2180012 [Novosphingobium sp. KN65.2]
MKAEISMPKLMKQISIKAVVTGARQVRFRIWLGTKVMLLAAWIIGCSIEIDTTQEGDQ